MPGTCPRGQPASNTYCGLPDCPLHCPSYASELGINLDGSYVHSRMIEKTSLCEYWEIATYDPSGNLVRRDTEMRRKPARVNPSPGFVRPSDWNEYQVLDREIPPPGGVWALASEPTRAQHVEVLPLPLTRDGMVTCSDCGRLHPLTIYCACREPKPCNCDDYHTARFCPVHKHNDSVNKLNEPVNKLGRRIKE